MPHRRQWVGWIHMLGACIIVIIDAHGVRAQGSVASPSPTSRPPGQVTLSPLPEPASTSVEELAKRLRAMEQANKKLAEQLDRNTREHDEQMRLLLERYGELSRR